MRISHKLRCKIYGSSLCRLLWFLCNSIKTFSSAVEKFQFENCLRKSPFHLSFLVSKQWVLCIQRHYQPNTRIKSMNEHIFKEEEKLFLYQKSSFFHFIWSAWDENSTNKMRRDYRINAFISTLNDHKIECFHPSSVVWN